jgi:hypothetical protein
MMFKFENLKEDYMRTNTAVGFNDPLPRNPGIGLGLGTSHIKLFSVYFKTMNIFYCDFGQI